MKLEEAIKVHEELKKNLTFAPDARLEAALKLGIEALKWRLHQEQAWEEGSYRLLPGQTR